MSDLRRDYFLTRLLNVAPDNAERLEAVFAELTAAAIDQFAAEGVAAEQVTFHRRGNLRYANQEHGVEIELPSSIGASEVEAIERSFHDSYEREYTYRLDAPVEFVGGHLIAVAEVGKLEPARLPVTGKTLADASKGTTRRRLRDGGHPCGRDLRRRPARARGVVRGPGDRRVEGLDDGRPSGEPGGDRRLREPRHLARGRRLMGRSRTRADHARDHPELAAGHERRDVRGVPQDRDERDHLRGARHGHRDHGRGGAPRLVRRRHPRVRRRARQGRHADHRAERRAGRDRARRHLRHERPLLRRRHPSQRRRSRHAGLPGRQADRVDGEHRALERRRRDGAGVDLDRRDRALPGGPPDPRRQARRRRATRSSR